MGLCTGWMWLPDRGLKLLGGSIGDTDLCARLTAERVQEVQKLFGGILNYDHCQSACLLLRHCASWSKLVYAARTVPPHVHRGALASLACHCAQASSS